MLVSSKRICDALLKNRQLQQNRVCYEQEQQYIQLLDVFERCGKFIDYSLMDILNFLTKVCIKNGFAYQNLNEKIEFVYERIFQKCQNIQENENEEDLRKLCMSYTILNNFLMHQLKNGKNNVKRFDSTFCQFQNILKKIVQNVNIKELSQNEKTWLKSIIQVPFEFNILQIFKLDQNAFVDKLGVNTVLRLPQQDSELYKQTVFTNFIKFSLISRLQKNDIIALNYDKLSIIWANMKDFCVAYLKNNEIQSSLLQILCALLKNGEHLYYQSQKHINLSENLFEILTIFMKNIYKFIHKISDQDLKTLTSLLSYDFVISRQYNQFYYEPLIECLITLSQQYIQSKQKQSVSLQKLKTLRNDFLNLIIHNLQIESSNNSSQLMVLLQQKFNIIKDKDYADLENQALLSLLILLSKSVNNQLFLRNLFEAVNSRYPILNVINDPNSKVNQLSLRFQIFVTSKLENHTSFNKLCIDLIQNGLCQQQYAYKKITKLVSNLQNNQLLGFVFQQLVGFLGQNKSNQAQLDVIILNLIYKTACQLKKTDNISKFHKEFSSLWIFILFNCDKDIHQNLLQSLAFITPILLDKQAKLYSNQFLLQQFDIDSQNKVRNNLKAQMSYNYKFQKIQQQYSISDLNLGEALNCVAVDTVLQYKMRVFYQPCQNLQEPFIAQLVDYLSDNNINHTQKFKVSFQAMIGQHLKTYLNMVSNLNESFYSYNLRIKDVQYLVLNSCSQNLILQKNSQSSLNIYLKQFTNAAFHPSLLQTFVETIDFLYKKINAEYRSISSILVKDVALPTNQIENRNILVYLLSVLLRTIIYGYFIDSKFLKRMVAFLIKKNTSSYLELSFGYAYLRFASLNFKPKQQAYLHNDKVMFKSNWIINQSQFHEQIKQINIEQWIPELLKPFSNVPNYSSDISIDYSSVLFNFNEIIQTDNEKSIETLNLYDDIDHLNFNNILNSFNELKQLYLNQFIIYILLKQKGFSLQKLIKNKTTFCQVYPEIQAILVQKETSTFQDKLKLLQKKLYVKIFDKINLTFYLVQSKKVSGQEVFKQHLETIKHFMLPKVLKYLFNNVINNLHFFDKTFYNKSYLNQIGLFLQFVISEVNKQIINITIIQKNLISEISKIILTQIFIQQKFLFIDCIEQLLIIYYIF